jgi:hypothetical protein
MLHRLPLPQRVKPHALGNRPSNSGPFVKRERNSHGPAVISPNKLNLHLCFMFHPDSLELRLALVDKVQNILAACRLGRHLRLVACFQLFRVSCPPSDSYQPCCVIWVLCAGIWCTNRAVAI